MDFKKDLLLIDLETTGLDVSRHEIIQLAVLLLDRKTLKEKKSFVSYIRPVHWANRDKTSMKVNQIDWEQVKNAPTLKSTIQKLGRIPSPKKVTLTYYAGILDVVFLQKAYQKLNKKFPFDYHYFNIWAVFYAYLARQGKLKNKREFIGFRLEDLIKRFRIKIAGTRHDALYDCRIEAEILRKVISKL